MYSVNCRPTRVIGSGNAQHENAEENVQQYVPHGSDPQQFVPQWFIMVDPSKFGIFLV